MTESSSLFNLKGLLNISVDNNPVKIECEGQEIKLTFTSCGGLRKFMRCHQLINQMVDPQLTKKFLKNLNLSYFINGVLIGESNKTLPSTLLGKYIGLENSKFYFKNFLKYLLSI